jgi:hypothetical protein
MKSEKRTQKQKLFCDFWEKVKKKRKKDYAIFSDISLLELARGGGNSSFL